MTESIENRFRLALEKLAAGPPSTKTALIRRLLPAIEATFASGKTWKDIWKGLADDGLNMSYGTFRKLVVRTRKKAGSSAALCGKSPEVTTVGPQANAGVDARDPLANIKRLEQNRPGFHWRATPTPKNSELSWPEWREKNKRNNNSTT